MPYGYYAGPPQRRKGSGCGWLVLVTVVVLVVVVGLVRAAATAVDVTSGSGPEQSYDTDVPADVAKNPLLTDPDATLLPANCDYAEWDTDVATARKFFASAEQCLEAAWQPVLDNAGLSFEPPSVRVSESTDGISTPCTGSTSNFAAFYCPANMTIYLPISQLQTDLFGDEWVVYLSVFAHEYGHHVQSQAGVLQKANKERVDTGPRSTDGLELSRRIELQANCFDGMYLSSSAEGGSLTDSQMSTANEDAGQRGDKVGDMRDHGTAENGGRWFGLGVEHNAAPECNTFIAPAAQVR